TFSWSIAAGRLRGGGARGGLRALPRRGRGRFAGGGGLSPACWPRSIFVVGPPLAERVVWAGRPPQANSSALTHLTICWLGSMERRTVWPTAFSVTRAMKVLTTL